MLFASRKTFKGGVHPPGFKTLSRDSAVKRLKIPPEVVISLIQHAGSPCLPVVKIGDEVKAGTLIAQSEKLISAPIHSSVSGKVKAIRKANHPVLGKCESIIIESDGRDEAEKLILPRRKEDEVFSAEEIREIIKQAGIVGLGGAAFPTHVKLMPPKDKPIDTFILNGAECEPFLTCDERIMIERPKEVLSGAMLLMEALGVKNGIIAIEDNKPRAINAIQVALNELRTTNYKLRTIVLATKYPQGGEKQAIKAILNRDVPAGGLPFEVGCVVDNVQTALAVHEAVYESKPLYERVITVSGDAINEPANILVRIGTATSYIIENCKGLKKPLSKIIIGGPMMGVAQYSADVPVIKGTSGILLLSADSAGRAEEGVCIRCGRCIEICPMRLMPTTIMNLVKKEKFSDAAALGVSHCFECGACAYGCPAKIPLLDYMKFGKSKI